MMCRAHVLATVAPHAHDAEVTTWQGTRQGMLRAWSDGVTNRQTISRCLPVH